MYSRGLRDWDAFPQKKYGSLDDADLAYHSYYSHCFFTDHWRARLDAGHHDAGSKKYCFHLIGSSDFASTLCGDGHRQQPALTDFFTGIFNGFHHVFVSFRTR